jgi:hypothetical protein
MFQSFARFLVRPTAVGLFLFIFLAFSWPRRSQSADPPATDGVATEAAGQTNEIPLFDGKSLEGWRIIDTFDFRRHGKVYVKDKAIFLEQGEPATGISWKGELPRTNYEITLEGQRVEGSDFFCGLTFPVKEEYCTLILGGWGGSVVGLSNVDTYSAVENETTQAVDFKNKRWYAIRLRVTDQRIKVWIDDDELIDLETQGRRFSIYWEQDPVKPLGLVTWQTSGALRNLKLKRITP